MNQQDQMYSTLAAHKVVMYIKGNPHPHYIFVNLSLVVVILILIVAELYPKCYFDTLYVRNQADCLGTSSVFLVDSL